MPGLGGGEGAPHAPELGSWPSERIIVPLAGSPRLLVGKVGNPCPRDPLQGRRRRAERSLEGPRGETPGSPTVSMQLQSSAPPAQRSPARVCDHVLHLLDRECWLEASRRTRKNSAPGVDKVTAKHDAATLDDTLRDRPERRRDHR